MDSPYSDYTYLYSTRIQKTFDEDQADILEIFRTAFARNPKLPIHLVNYYKGLPISYKAKIAGIDKNAMDLDINPKQAVAISTEHYTFIKCKLFKYDILAQSQYVNVRRKAVLLSKFCYVEIMAESRKHLRLLLEPPVNALFNSPSGIIRGKVIELSMGGAVLEVSEAFNEEIDTEANLIIMIPDLEQNTNYNLRIPAKLVSIQDDCKPKRFKFSITPDKITDRFLAKHMYHRQVQIIHELQDASELG